MLRLKLILLVSLVMMMCHNAFAADLVAVRAGIICTSPEALARLTLPNGGSRSDLPGATAVERRVFQDGGCLNVTAGTRVVLQTARKNTSIVLLKLTTPSGSSERRFYLANVDFRSAPAVSDVNPGEVFVAPGSPGLTRVASSVGVAPASGAVAPPAPVSAPAPPAVATPTLAAAPPAPAASPTSTTPAAAPALPTRQAASAATSLPVPTAVTGVAKNSVSSAVAVPPTTSLNTPSSAPNPTSPPRTAAVPASGILEYRGSGFACLPDNSSVTVQGVISQVWSNDRHTGRPYHYYVLQTPAPYCLSGRSVDAVSARPTDQLGLLAAAGAESAIDALVGRHVVVIGMLKSTNGGGPLVMFTSIKED